MQTPIDRAALLDAYLQHQLDSMSGRDLETFFLDTIAEMLEGLTTEELLAEALDAYPDLLERLQA